MSEFDRLARELEARIDRLVEATIARLAERVAPEVMQATFTAGEIRAFARASLRAQLHAFRRRTLPERCPPVDAEAARTVSKVGELRVLLNGYWACQISLWEAWLELVETAEPGAPARRELLGSGSDFLFRYAALIGDYVADIYQRELQHAARDGEGRRFQAIRRLLEGESPAPIDLDFDLERHHLGLIAWGPGGEQAARDLAASLERPLIVLGPINHSWWGWISGVRPFDPGEERRLDAFRPPEGAGIALGLQAFGEAGFRATHRQALRARRAARATEPALIRYADVAIESLAGENKEEARAFLARELRGINDDSVVSRRIRETLEAYFEAGYNAASAAVRLGVHQQTVANRLRAAEERLGHSVGTRRVELEVALRLRASLPRADS